MSSIREGRVNTELTWRLSTAIVSAEMPGDGGHTVAGSGRWMGLQRTWSEVQLMVDREELENRVMMIDV